MPSRRAKAASRPTPATVIPTLSPIAKAMRVARESPPWGAMTRTATVETTMTHTHPAQVAAAPEPARSAAKSTRVTWKMSA